MSQNQPTEHPIRIRSAPASSRTRTSISNSFKYPSNSNITNCSRTSSFLQCRVTPTNNNINQMNETNYSRHILSAQRTGKESFKITQIQVSQTEQSENPSSNMERTNSIKSVQIKIPCQESNSQRGSTTSVTTPSTNPTIPTQEYSLTADELQQNIESQHAGRNHLDDSPYHSRVGLLPALKNRHTLETVIKMNDEENTSSKRLQPNSSQLKQESLKQKSEALGERPWRYTCCQSLLARVIVFLFVLLVVLAILIPVLAVFVIKDKTITTTTMLTTIINSTTARTVGAEISNMETTDTTEITNPMTSEISSYIDCVNITNLSRAARDNPIGITLATGMTTLLKKTTSRTAICCGQSCLKQSWIDPSNDFALWSFDDTYMDLINSYNGIASSKLPTFETGYFGQAVFFNITARQAIFTPFIPLSNISFTIEVWLKPTGYSNPVDSSIVGLCPAAIMNYCLHISIRYEKLYFGFYHNDIQGRTKVLLNRWIHAAFVFDAPTKAQTIYLNGVQDGRRIASSVFKAKSGYFTIGVNERVLNTVNNFEGYIDQLSISQRTKSACEILERATLAAHFKFDTTSPYNDSGPNRVPTTFSNTSIIAGYKNQAISLGDMSFSYFQTWGFTSLGIADQPFSITMWIKPEILSGTLLHLSTSSLGTGSTCFSLLGFSSDGTIVAQVLTNSSNIVTATGSVLPVSSSWTFIVQTWSSTNGLKLYINDTLVSVVSAPSFLGSETTPNYLTLGNCLNGCSECVNGSVDVTDAFRGAIDDWRIYSRELTATDVCTLFL